MMRWRPCFAALRMGFYYALFCVSLLYLALQARDFRENGRSAPAQSPALPSDHAPRLGTTIELEQYTPAEQRQALARLHNGGLHWVRQRFDWRLMEPQPGQFDWRTADAMLANISQSGLMPVVVLDGSPPWARDARDQAPRDNPLAPPADPADFARFAGAFAARYAAQVRYYQIWNEPNIAPHWGDRHIEPVEYARLLYAAGRAIRTADADVRIVTAALAPTADRGHTAIDEVYFLRRLYAAARQFDASQSGQSLTTGGEPTAQFSSVPRLFDAVAVEPFGFGHAALDPRQRLDLLNFQRVRLVRRAMVAAGDEATPLWAVRFGWNTRVDSPWGVVSTADQARFARQAVALAQNNWPWLDVLGWAIDQPSAPAADPMWGFALDEPLLTSFAGEYAMAAADEQAAGQADASSPLWFWLQIGLLMLLWPLILWRSYAAWKIVELPRWVHQSSIYAVGWFILAWIYMAAVWPPLIGLCWLGFAWLAWRAPQSVLCAAAALLPFYFQHKELTIVDWQWQIAPAYMLLWALLPALIRDFWRRVFSKPGSSNPINIINRRAGIPIRRVGSMRDVLSLSTVRRFGKPPYGIGAALRRVGREPRRFWSMRGAISLSSIHLHPLDWLALAWLGVNLASSTNVWHWPAYGQGFMEQALAPLLLYAATRIWGADAAMQRRLAIWLFGGGLLAALWGWAGWLQGAGTLADGVRRLVGPHFSPNHTALYLERTFFLGMGLALGATGVRKWAWFMGCAAVMGALLLTFSRGALLIALPAGAALVYFCTRARLGVLLWAHKGQRCHLIGLIFAGALLLLSFWLFADRLTNSASVVQRFESWRAVWRLWCDYPLLGVGPGGFFWRYPAYTLENAMLNPNLRHPHNLWLAFTTSWGLMGLGWLFVLCGVLGRQLWQFRVQGRCELTDPNWSILWLPIGIGAGLVAGLMHGQVDAFMALADLASWNWLALALLASTFLLSMPTLHSDRSQSSM